MLYMILFLVHSTFAAFDFCAEDTKKYCAKKASGEIRWTCLAAKWDVIPESCRDQLHEETKKEKKPCYIHSLALCNGESLITKSFLCLTEKWDKLPKDCQEALISMRKRGQKYKEDIQKGCASDFKKFCPKMDEVKQSECLRSYYQQKLVSNPCQKAIDASLKRK